MQNTYKRLIYYSTANVPTLNAPSNVFDKVIL